MGPAPGSPPPPPFGFHDYRISYVHLSEAREVSISALLAQRLAVGDGVDIERADGLYSLLVTEVADSEGGWRARCRVIEFQERRPDGA